MGFSHHFSLRPAQQSSPVCPNRFWTIYIQIEYPVNSQLALLMLDYLRDSTVRKL
jgi:hypothetical protein